MDPRRHLSDRTEAILDAHLDEAFRVFPLAAERTSLGEIQALSRRLGIRFPDAFVAHLGGSFPGLFVEVKKERWPPPHTHEVRKEAAPLYSLHTFTANSHSPAWMRLELVAHNFFLKTGRRAVPVLEIVRDADVYCLTQEGDLARYRHAEGSLEPVRKDFWQILDDELRALAVRTREASQQRSES
jgi:hypothetical protein